MGIKTIVNVNEFFFYTSYPSFPHKVEMSCMREDQF